MDGSIAVDVYFYIDDGRSTAGPFWDCWKASRKACCTLIHHRLQDAERKRTGTSKDPGERTGTMVETTVLVSVKSGKG